MFPVAFIILFSLSGPTLSAVSRNHDERKSRVFHDDLSRAPHEVDGVHNPKYDQEALFGEDAKRFEDLAPEEALKQLSAIFVKMDLDHDQLISPHELRTWLRKVHQRISTGDTKRVWAEYGLQPSESLTWDQFWNHAVGEDGDYEDDDEKTKNYNLIRDRRRWAIADADVNGQLTLTEAVAFFNPESDPKMHDTLVKETIEELDKDGDGTVDVEEFIADIWKPSGEEQEPEWVTGERKDFIERRDINHDGKLDESEIKAWRFPSDYDYTEAEVQHLFAQCDTDRDGRLSLSEMESRYDVLVGSSATNYGEVFSDHDEL